MNRINGILIKTVYLEENSKLSKHPLEWIFDAVYQLISHFFFFFNLISSFQPI